VSDPLGQGRLNLPNQPFVETQLKTIYDDQNRPVGYEKLKVTDAIYPPMVSETQPFESDYARIHVEERER